MIFSASFLEQFPSAGAPCLITAAKEAVLVFSPLDAVSVFSPFWMTESSASSSREAACALRSCVLWLKRQCHLNGICLSEGVRKEEKLNGYLLYPPSGNSIHLTFSQPL